MDNQYSDIDLTQQYNQTIPKDNTHGTTRIIILITILIVGVISLGFVFLRRDKEKEITSTTFNTKKSSHNDSLIQMFIREGCAQYFDGCNTCDKVDESIFRCTLMACFKIQEPKCISYIEKIIITPKRNENNSVYHELTPRN